MAEASTLFDSTRYQARQELTSTNEQLRAASPVARTNLTGAASSSLMDGLLTHVPAALARAKVGIDTGSDIEGSLGILDELEAWRKKNMANLLTVVKAKTRTPMDSELQKNALAVMSREGVDMLRARGRVELSATQVPADVIRIKIPGMIEQAKALLGKGELDEGKKMMDMALASVKENEKSLRLATSYTGSNPLAMETRKAATDLLTGKWYTELLPMTDKRTNQNYADKIAIEGRMGPNQLAVYKDAMYSNDQQDKDFFQSVHNAQGGLELNQRAKANRTAARPGQTPSAADAADQPVNTFDGEKFSSYARNVYKDHLKPLGLVLSGSEAGSVVRDLYEADLATNGAGASYAAGKVKEARAKRAGAVDQALDVSIFKTSAQAYKNSVVGYAGDVDDVQGMRLGAEVFKHLTKDIPADGWTPGKMEQISGAATRAGDVMRRMDTFAPGASVSSGKYLAGALYKNATNGKMDDDEKRVFDTFTSHENLVATINREPPLATKETAELYAGYHAMSQSAESTVHAITADALKRGITMTPEGIRSALKEDGGLAETALAKEFKRFVPGMDDNTLRMASRIVADVWADTGKYNPVEVPRALKAAAEAALDARKPTGQPGGPGEAEKGQKEYVDFLTKGVQSYAAALPQGSPDRLLIEGLSNADLTPGSADLQPGEADTHAARAAIVKAWAPTVSSAFQKNQAVVDYYKNLRVGDMKDRGKINKEVAKLIMNSLHSASPLLRTGGLTPEGQKALQTAAVTYADNYTTMVMGKTAGMGDDAVVATAVGDEALLDIAPANIKYLISMGMAGGTRANIRTFGEEIADALMSGERGWEVKSRLYKAAIVGQKAPATKEEAKVDTVAKQATLTTMKEFDDKTLKSIVAFSDQLDRRVTNPFKDKASLEYYNGLPQTLFRMGIDNPTEQRDVQTAFLETMLQNPENTNKAYAEAKTRAKKYQLAAFRQKSSWETQASIKKAQDEIAAGVKAPPGGGDM